MIFSDIYKSPRSPIAKLRHQPVQISTPLTAITPGWVGEEHADLLSKDKLKQKDAVKRYLDAKVKNDWDFPWPSRVDSTEDEAVLGDDGEKPVGLTALDVSTDPVQDETREEAGYQVDDEGIESDDSDVESVYSTVSEDTINFRPRIEWTSDLSDDDEPLPSRSPFRFDSPGTVGATVKAAMYAKQAKRRRAVREEMEWNNGLACFEARRVAWTGARTVRVRTKPTSPPIVSPRSPRRFFFRRSMSSSPPSSTAAGSDGSDSSSLAKGEELQKQQSKDTNASTPPPSRAYPVETLIPIAPPLLPPSNPLRASITPSVYLSLYDKVIIHNLQPSCPINLSDMLRSCVAGWKRDGEWPPRLTMAPPTPAKKKKKPAPPPVENSNKARRMSFGLLGRDKDEESAPAKIFRRSLQKALAIGNYGAQDVSSPKP